MAKQEGYQSIGMLKAPFFLKSQISVECSFSLSLSRYHTNEGNLASHNNNLRKHTYISDIVRTKETSCIQEP